MGIFWRFELKIDCDRY